MTKPEQLAVKERLAAETKARIAKVWDAPGFAAEHEAWRTERRATAETCTDTDPHCASDRK